MSTTKKEATVKFITDDDVKHIIRPIFNESSKTKRCDNDNVLITPTNQKGKCKLVTPTLNSNKKVVSDLISARIRTSTDTNKGRIRKNLLNELKRSDSQKYSSSSDESIYDDEDKDKTVTGLSTDDSSDDYSDTSGDDKNYNDDNRAESTDEDTNPDDEDDNIDLAKSQHPIVFLKELRGSRLLTKKHTSEFDEELPFHSDYYFLKKSEKSTTSANTLSCLAGPKLMPDKLKTLLSECNNENHHEEKQRLIEKYKIRFCRWLFYLLEGFSLLLYGHGSKRNLLNLFRSEYLSENKVLVINGFFPGLTVKEVLETFLRDILNIEINNVTDSEELIKMIKSKLQGSNKSPVFLVVHNIDGDALRSKKNQTLLAKLTSIPNVHMIASFDHINTPLSWSNNLLVMFNFLWINTTTFEIYNMETSFETSLFIQKTGSPMIMSSLVNVFSSLTSNTQRIFLLLVKDHLENKHNKKFQGVQFSDLYNKSRNAMLVTSDLALRTQLTEFVDHEIIKWRREADIIFIPIPVPILAQFYETHCTDDDL